MLEAIYGAAPREKPANDGTFSARKAALVRADAHALFGQRALVRECLRV